MIRSALLGTVVLGSLLVVPVRAQDAPYPVSLVAGSCDDPGDVVAELSDADLPNGDPHGESSFLPAALSYTTADDVSFLDVIDGPHAVVVGDPSNPLACGNVGGNTDDGGGLSFGLRGDAGGSGLSGVAYLGPAGGDETGLYGQVAVFGPTAQPQERADAAEQPEDTADGAEGGEGQSPAVATMLAAGSGGGAAARRTPTPRPEPTAVPTPTPAPGTSEDSPVPVGSTVESDGLAVTINSAYYDYSFANAIPRGGFKLLILEVAIENVGDGSVRYAASNFSGEDANSGAGYNAVGLDNVGVLLTDGDLDPGEYVTGTVLIEVQETAASVIVKYDPAMFDPNDLYWIV